MIKKNISKFRAQSNCLIEIIDAWKWWIMAIWRDIKEIMALFCFHLSTNTLHHHRHRHHHPNIWTIKQKDSGTWCDTLSARLGFLYRFYWKHSKAKQSNAKNISIWEMRAEGAWELSLYHWLATMRLETIYVCERLTFLPCLKYIFDFCQRCRCCRFFFVVILFIRLVWAALWLWIVTRPPTRFHSMCGFAFLWNTEPLVMLLNLYIRSNFRAPFFPYMHVLCTHCVLFRFHSLKYYIFTFRHNINNVQREKRAGMRSCVRACMPCHRIRESKNPFHLSAVRAVVLITIVIMAITIMHTNRKKNTQVTLTENTLGSISLTRSEGVSLIPTIHIHFEPVFTPLQIKCHYGAYSIWFDALMPCLSVCLYTIIFYGQWMDTNTHIYATSWDSR